MGPDLLPNLDFVNWPIRLDDLLADPRARGQGIRVGLIDTGIDRAILEFQSQRSLAIEGAIFTPESRVPLAYQGYQSAPHGTTVAGILLQHAPEVSLVSADIFGPKGRCDADTLIRAIQWCIDKAHCQVLNLSLGITEDRLYPVQRRWQLQRIIDDCYHGNVTVVAAAHNDHPHSRSFPAVLGAPLIGVCKGPWHEKMVIQYSPNAQVEFQATGSSTTDVLSLQPASSWAAPHVTAIVARLLSLSPALRPFEIKALLRRLSYSLE